MESGGGPALSLTWAHRAEQSAHAWEQSHARGDVPSIWPYGLDALRDHAAVEVVDLPAPGRLARARARLSMGPRPVDGLAVTWDENTAYRMQTLHPRARFATGVIWLTDMIADGNVPSQLIAMLNRAEAAWVLSEAQVEPLRRALGPRGPRVFAVPFGIDSDFFGPKPYPDRPRIVSVGNDRDRDPATLYAALARVLAVRPETEVMVQTRSDLVPPEGVRVVRNMPHAELRDLYATASVVAIPTRPNLHASGMTVALEALATARPVVVSATPGMEQYVSEGRTGRLVPPEDPAELALAILRLLDDPVSAAELGRNGRLEVEHRFTTQIMVAALVKGLLHRVEREGVV
ncbi:MULTISPECIES: glycosyltransferase family 4 protein [unclassified Microbacterium]|uniref:glycosyltransferase family 4 protein n=1 Tax=unclassified Microbacterium TaxID=2609290 RepID=UPI001605449F|nr:MULTISPECIES: glycosyltransferase family 4 protein [unclassified Microbacterium]QNA91714.1 glycosyltransferase family 4 protein [Microbacterium sp. Se63.02b]QYM64905.1 glycosyltransferase family 4 protein [Microbacterium sp. Se5.02b]